MKGWGEQSKRYSSRHPDALEDVEDLGPVPESIIPQERTRYAEISDFGNHFVVRRGVHQQPQVDCSTVPVHLFGDKPQPVVGKKVFELDSVISKLNDADLPSLPTAFTSPRMDLYYKQARNIEGDTEIFKNIPPSKAEHQHDHSFQPLIPRGREGSDSVHEIDSVASNALHHPCIQKNAKIPKGMHEQPTVGYRSSSSLRSSALPISSIGKYNSSGKPNVYQNNSNSSLTLSIKEETISAIELSMSHHNPKYQTSMIISQSSGSGLDIADLLEERPHTATVEKIQTDLENRCMDQYEAERPSYTTASHSTSFEDTKTTLSPAARPFLPFPFGRPSTGKSGLSINRFLTSDNTKQNIDLRSLAGNAREKAIRQAPFLEEFPDERCSITRGFSRSLGNSKLGTSALSPMDSRYSLISTFVRKSESLTQSRRMELPSHEAVMRVCGQQRPIPMDLIFQGLKNLEKVGEGVFGEVFSGCFVENGNLRVYKIVAIEGNELVNGERQKSYAEILPEILISQQLSKLHEGYRKCFTDGFIKLHNARITSGIYPSDLVTAWSKWNKRHNSDNDCPNFKSDQLYIVFEYDHGGQDVESFCFNNARQTFYLTLQVAYILAVGEGAMEMEHRDLHWGNILVEKTDYQNVTYHFNGKSMTIPSFGVKACIIDFTIARLVDDENNPIYLDLKEDEEQFLGTGDHQFDIYRMMRDLNRNEWEEFFPKTNIFWVHYLAEKFSEKGRYSDTTSYVHRFFMKELRQLKNSIMDYASCAEFALSPACERFKHLKCKPSMSSS